MLYFLLINYGFITGSSCMILGTSIALNSTYQLPSPTEGTPKELRRNSEGISKRKIEQLARQEPPPIHHSYAPSLLDRPEQPISPEHPSIATLPP